MSGRCVLLLIFRSFLQSDRGVQLIADHPCGQSDCVVDLATALQPLLEAHQVQAPLPLRCGVQLLEPPRPRHDSGEQVDGGRAGRADLPERNHQGTLHWRALHGLVDMHLVRVRYTSDPH